MVRVSKKYDREEFLMEVQIVYNTRKAIAEGDWERWKSIKETYLTSCLETLYSEKGSGADWRDDGEVCLIVNQVIGHAFIHFNKSVFVRTQHVGGMKQLIIVEHSRHE